jgi:hypothetical protein
VPNSQLTLSNIEDEIRTRLGGSGLDIEIVHEDYRTIIKQAIRLLNTHRPQRSIAALSGASADTVKYELSHPGLVGLLDVQMVTRRDDVTKVDPFDPYSTIQAPVTTGMGTFGEYANDLAYQEDARRVVSAEFEWRGQWEGDKYYLYAEIPRTLPIDISYTYAWHLTPDDDATTGLSRMPDYDVDWFMDYVEALAKIRLGRIRAKHHGIPGPDGSPMDTDYSDLIEEGRADKERLEEALKNRRRPLVPVIE